ncbi:MAG: MFS transporter [Steroidobacteraceae bacterium]|jgi:ACS family hexuronate transporter-like MFS transporter|nr:MFS transporter [Steroidobacteraceae bacterium]
MATTLPGALVQPWYTQKRWWVAILLCAVTMIGYIDRLALSVVAPVVKREFGFSNEAYGLITWGFLLTYALGQLFLGPVIDRLGSKRSLSLGVTWWSIAGVAHAFGQGVGSFLAARAFLGITEAVNFPAAYKVVAEWFPRAERSLASGFITAGVGIGAIVAPPMIAAIIVGFDHLKAIGWSPIDGWHAAFIIPGLMGFVWVWIWNRWFHPVETDPGLEAAERELILADRPAVAPAERRGYGAELAAYFRGMRYWFRYRETWGLAAARFTGDGAFYFFAFWIPLYLVEERGFDLLQVAWAAALPFVFADVGSFFGGWAGQRLIRGGMSVDASRKTMIWAGALCVPFALPAVWVDSPVLAVVLMGIGVMAIQVKSASLFAVPADLFPPHAVATVWGASGAAGSLAAAFSQPVIGWVIDTWSYEPVFVAVSLMHVVSALCVTLFVRRIEPVRLKEGAVP